MDRATVSGGPGSLVPWAALGREGRRHALTYVRPEPLHRPARGRAGPVHRDRDGRAGRGHPGPGLRQPGQRSRPPGSGSTSPWPRWSAPAPSTGRCIMLISPTGTGYVNYVAVAAAAVPHARRRRHGHPAVLQAAVPAVAGQDRGRPGAEPAAVAAHPRAAARPPRRRARGSCCSARASGRTPARTPSCTGARSARRPSASTARCGSGRRTAAGGCTRSPGPDRLDVDRDSVAVVNDYAQLRPLGDERRARLRYVLVSHDNDGVTKFGPDLLDDRPALARARTGPRPRTCRGPAPAASRRRCGGGRSRRSSRA